MDASGPGEDHVGGAAWPHDVDVVWASDREGNVFGFDAEKGTVLWKTNLIAKHSAKLPMWNLAAAPLVLDEMVIMNVGPVIACDKNGKEIRKTKNYGDAYATPVGFLFQKKRFVAAFSSSGLTILSRKSGKQSRSRAGRRNTTSTLRPRSSSGTRYSSDPATTTDVRCSNSTAST